MIRKIAAAYSLALAAACVMAQSPQAAPAAPAAATASTDDDLTIHYKGPGVVAPELLSINGKFDAIEHCKKLDGDERLLIAVDRTGKAQTILFLKSLGSDLDEMARHVVELDKFKPGAVDGAPANVGVAVAMSLEACRMEKKDQNGRKQSYIELRSQPEQTLELVEEPEDALTELPPKPGTTAWNKMTQGLYHVGGGVSAPVLIHSVTPEFSEEARRAHYGGICLLSVVVDMNGLPQNPRVVRPLGMGLDDEALKTVRQFRFKPAMKDGKTPVPVMITVEVNFRSSSSGAGSMAPGTSNLPPFAVSPSY